MKQVLLLLSIVCCTAATNAQEITCRVQSKVKDAAHHATILVSLDGNQKSAITTDSNGYYTTKLRVPGYYDVKIFANGCDTQLVTGVMVSPGRKTTFDAILTEIHNNQPRTKFLSYEGRNRTIEYPMFSIYDKDIAIKTEKPIHTATNIPFMPMFFIKKVPDHLDTLNTDKQLLSMLTSDYPKRKHTVFNWISRKRAQNQL